MPKNYSQFPPAPSTPSTADILPIYQGGKTVRTTLGALFTQLASFIQSGTGAVATDLQTRGRQIVYVTDYSANGVSGAKVDTAGVTDSALGVQAALTFGATFGSAEVIVPPNTKIKCNSGLSIDTNKVKFTLNGSQLDFSGMTTGDAFTITNSNSDANVRAYLNAAHPITGGVFVGPGVATTAVTCAKFNDTSGVNSLAATTFRDCAFVNFATDVTLGTGAIFVLFDNCALTSLSGTPTTYSVVQAAGGTNYGENNVFRNCRWYNRKLVYTQANVNADTTFENCSLDYATGRSITITGGRVKMIGGHLEQSDDSDYYVSVTGSNALFRMDGVDINITGNKSAFSPFYSDSTCTIGGVEIVNSFLGGTGLGVSLPQPLINGTGRTWVKNLAIQAGATQQVISAYANQLAYGGFESGTLAGDGWTVSATGTGVTPAASGAQFHAGANSLLFSATVGVGTSVAKVNVPVTSGESVNGEFWYLIPTTTATGWTFTTSIDWLDAGGNVISNVYTVNYSAVQATWLRQAISSTGPAPKGARNLRFLQQVTGTIAVATFNAYLDDIVLTVT